MTFIEQIAAYQSRIGHLMFMAATGILVAGSLARFAAADEYDTLNVVVGGSVTHDSNLFRSTDSAGPRSDTIKAGYVGLRIDKPYAQQRFQADVTETASRYEKFSYLNFDAFSYRGAWLWHLSPRVSGTLSADRTESLSPFEEALSRQRNLRISENRVFNLDAWISGGWHGLLGVSQSKQTSEQAFQAVPDFRSVSEEAGVRYIALSGSSVSVTRRSIQGHYLNSAFVPVSVNNDSYGQDESELMASWILSGRSTMTGRLTWIERHNDNFTQGNFSGLAGELGYGWVPANELHLDFLAKRSISPYYDVSSTYRVDNSLAFAPSWQVSGKITARARLEYVQSYFSGGVAVPNVPARNDTARNVLLGVDWAPLRGVTVGASLQRQRHTSNVIFYGYDDTIASVNASLMF